MRSGRSFHLVTLRGSQRSPGKESFFTRPTGQGRPTPLTEGGLETSAGLCALLWLWWLDILGGFPGDSLSFQRRGCGVDP